jgi:hypothetical protein
MGRRLPSYIITTEMQHLDDVVRDTYIKKRQSAVDF